MILYIYISTLNNFLSTANVKRFILKMELRCYIKTGSKMGEFSVETRNFTLFNWFVVE